jgi:hypothetical protein
VLFVLEERLDLILLLHELSDYVNLHVLDLLGQDMPQIGHLVV